MSTSLSAVIDEPQVLTGHTDVICSTSIERIITVRNTALVHIEALIHQLEDISAITNSIGGGIAKDWAMRQDFRTGCWFMEKAETAMKVITCNLDRGIWRDLMLKSGMLSLMDAQARDQWYRNLEGIIFLPSAKPTYSVPLSNSTSRRTRYLNAGSSIYSKDYPGTIKPTVHANLAKK